MDVDIVGIKVGSIAGKVDINGMVAAVVAAIFIFADNPRVAIVVITVITAVDLTDVNIFPVVAVSLDVNIDM